MYTYLCIPIYPQAAAATWEGVVEAMEKARHPLEYAWGVRRVMLRVCYCIYVYTMSNQHLNRGCPVQSWQDTHDSQNTHHNTYTQPILINNKPGGEPPLGRAELGRAARGAPGRAARGRGSLHAGAFC